MPDVFYMDNYDKCMMRGDESFFCSFDYHLEPLDSKNISDTWRIIQDVISDRMNYRHDRLRHYICVRDHCPGIPIMDENDPELWRLIEDCYNEKYEHMGLKGKITRMMCDTETTNRYPIGYFEILVAILLISYFGYVIFATFLEGVYRYKSEEEYNKFVNSPFGKFVAPFSLTINWIRLKAVKDGHPDIERLRCIQGVRTYNLLLVILSHTALSNLSLPLSNTRYAETVTEKFLNIFLSSGPLCVSTFFLMAGFLLAYGLFDYSEGKKELKPKELAMIFINRCIRLTPTLAFVLIIHATWLPHVSNGPLWDQYIGNEYRVCRKNWWTNLLYLHTYVNSEEMCMMQTWYLAVDTQFFILGLVLIYYMKKYENKIPLILGSCLGLHIVFTFIMNYIYDYEATIFPEPEIYYNIQLQKLGQWHSQLTASYGNIPGLVVGMAYGYAYYKYKNVKIFTSTRSVVFWWFTVLLLPLGIIIFPGLIIYDPNTPKNIFWASVYISLCRTVFTTGIGLVIFGVSQGIGWIAKMSLEWRPTYILGRIVYSSFLIHVALIKIRPALKRYPTYLEDFIIVSDLLCDIFTAFLSGLLLTLFVEMPISELQKLLVPQKRSKGEQQQQEKQEQEDEKKKIK
ncbi:nose resistant to fluoxetine protein 6 isoform X2 [Aethina tumida]|nr:nose resistant to fluoxetine protein 6 isoform X2 [Aethina tumida]